MLKRAILTLTAACVLAVPATAAAEHPHDDAAGTWDYAPVEINFDKEAGNQTFLSGVTADEFHGTFEGYGRQEFSLTHHAAKQFNIYWGVTEFEGTVTVDEVAYEGTMTIRTVGRQDPGYVLPSALPWEGTWVIVHGTGELEGIHGQGTFTGPSFSLVYEGTVHLTG